MSKEWNELDAEAKKPYLDQTEAQKKEYEENMKVYRIKKSEEEKAAAAAAAAASAAVAANPPAKAGKKAAKETKASVEKEAKKTPSKKRPA